MPLVPIFSVLKNHIYFNAAYAWPFTSFNQMFQPGKIDEHPELHKPLGAPQGSFLRTTPQGWEFTREFEHASVWVDTEKREGKITWQ